MRTLHHLRYFRYTSVAVASVIFVIETGCNREKERPSTGIKIGKESKYIEQMAADDVIVAINGVSLTREKYDDAIGVKETLQKLSKPKASAQELNSFRTYWSRGVINEYVARQAVLQAARTKNHQASDVAVQLSRADMCKLMKVEDEALEQKFIEMGRQGRALKVLLEENTMIRSFREAEHQQKLTVSKEEVDDHLKKIKAYHERSEATNQLVIAKGKAICEELKKGADFLKLVEQYSEGGDKPVGEWGSFLKGEIENAQIRNAAFSLPVGSVSEPFDTEEGLVIIKVLQRTSEVQGPTTVPSGPAIVKLGRILLRMAEGGLHVPPPSREDVEKAILDLKVKNLQNEWIPSLVAKAQIEYPNGTNFWMNAKSKKPAKSHKGMAIQTKEETP